MTTATLTAFLQTVMSLGDMTTCLLDPPLVKNSRNYITVWNMAKRVEKSTYDRQWQSANGKYARCKQAM